MRDEEERIRSIAGYLVKNNSRVSLMPSPEVAELVKASVTKALNDSNAMIRDTADQDFVADPRTEELARVPAAAGSDAGHGSRDEVDWQEAAFNVVEGACEQDGRESSNGTRLLHSMILILHTLANHLSSKMQFHAVVRLSHFVSGNCQSLSSRLGAFNAV